MSRNNGDGIWSTNPDPFWILGAANGLDTALLNAANDTVNFPLTGGSNFKVFISDYQNRMFISGSTFVLTVNFADGSSATGTVTVGGSGSATISLSYDGQIRDRVGAGAFAQN